MGHALIWIEGLAAMLLLVALLSACSARGSRRWRQLALPLLTALAILTVSCLLTYAAAWGKFHFHSLIPHDWFTYTLSWTIVFLCGVWMIFSHGLQRNGVERIPLARSWPRGRLTLALSGAVILFAITLSNMDLAMKVQLAEARAEASTVLLAMTPPPIDDKDNAAPIYQEAFAALTPIEKLPPPWKQNMETWREKEWQRTNFPDRLWGDFSYVNWRDPCRVNDWKRFLDSQHRALTLLRKAASKPACRFPSRDPLTFFDGAGRRYSPESHFSQASQLLALNARVQAASGDSRAAVEDIVAMLAIARHTSDLTVEKDGWETLAAVLHLSSPKPDELARLSRVQGEPYLQRFPKVQASCTLRLLLVLSPEFSSYWFWDMTKEVPFVYRKGHPMPRGYEAPWWFEATIMPLWRVFLGPDELLFIRRSLKACQESFLAPEQENFADWQALLQSLRAQEGGWFYMGGIRTRLESTALQACDVTTLRQMAHLAVALTAYRAKHGDYPKDLKELTPAFLDRLLSDPWDGGRLHMKATEAGVQLYTLRNGTVEPILSPNTAAQRRDIIFRLPRIHE